MNRRERRARARIESSHSKGSGVAQRMFSQALRHHQAGQFAQALAAYREVLKLIPRHPDAQNNVGIVLAAMGHREEALAAYRRTVDLKPDFAAGHYNLGHALRELGRQEEALAAYRRAIELDPGFARSHNNLGIILRDLGRHEEAVAAYLRAIEVDPAYADAHSNLGVTLHALGRYEEAVAACRRALELEPDHAEANNNLGIALAALGRLEEAEAAYRRAIQLKADYATAYNNLGTVLQMRGLLDEAVAACRRAIDLKPDYAGAYNNLGMALKELGRVEEALALYGKAAGLSTTGFEDPWVNKALLLIEMGKVTEALEVSSQALAVNPRSGSAWHVRSELKDFSAEDPDIATMQSLLAAGAQRLRPLDRMNLEFALGKAWMDAGDPGRAFSHFNEANRRKRATVVYDPEATSRLLASIAEVASPELMGRFAGAGHPSDVPIFVIGMPRSGTTLVEQILASHPEIHGAGELWTLQTIADGIPKSGAGRSSYPQALRELSPDDMTLLGRRYVERVAALAPGRPRIVDKMPTNFQYAGLIHLMLPNARIIHCRRDPVDTCMSCYIKNFRTGVRYSFDLWELGMFYRGYEALMAHWRERLPPERFTEVRYEDIVSDLEAQARRLLAFCGVEWNDACLAFHRTRRQIRTSSASQVRQPIYRTSVGRWIPYADHLGPLLAALGRVP